METAPKGMLGILQIWMERLLAVFPFKFRNLAPKLTSSPDESGAELMDPARLLSNDAQVLLFCLELGS